MRAHVRSRTACIVCSTASRQLRNKPDAQAGSVRLLAATKTRDIGEIMVAIDAGVRMIGENRPQEVTAKAEGLARRCAERGFSLGVAGAAAGCCGGAYSIPPDRPAAKQ